MTAPMVTQVTRVASPRKITTNGWIHRESPERALYLAVTLDSGDVLGRLPSGAHMGRRMVGSHRCAVI